MRQHIVSEYIYLEEHSPYPVTCLLLLLSSVFTVEPHGGHGTINAVTADFTSLCFNQYFREFSGFCSDWEPPRAPAGGS